MQTASDPERSRADAQELDQPPMFANEASEWCVGSCNGGNDEYEPNEPASFTLREDGSMYFTTNVNYSACPQFAIPENIDGWYFGTSMEQVAAARATAATNEEVAEWQTTGVQPFDDISRNNPDLMTCEALFIRGE